MAYDLYIERPIERYEVSRYTYDELLMVANTIEGEAGGLSEDEMRLVAWCICNRVDEGIWGDSITEVLSTGQFYAYVPERPLGTKIAKWDTEHDANWHAIHLMTIAQAVLDEWSNGEQADIVEPYAITPDYLYFYGDGEHNWYREVFEV